MLLVLASYHCTKIVPCSHHFCPLHETVTLKSHVAKDFLTSTVITLSLTSENYTAPENIGSLEVCVFLNAPLSFDFDIVISTTARNSATNGII